MLIGIRKRWCSGRTEAIHRMLVEKLTNAYMLARMRAHGNLVNVSRGYLVGAPPVNDMNTKGVE